MKEIVQEKLREQEKISILLQEYATLRTEILTRTTNLFQLLAVSVVVLTWIMGWGKDERFWIALGVLLVVLWYISWVTHRDIDKAASRLRELEKDINERANETLLVWETQWGGAVTGYWGKARPLQLNSTPRSGEKIPLDTP